VRNNNHLDLAELSAQYSEERKRVSASEVATPGGSERLYIRVESDEPLRIGESTFYPRPYLERKKAAAELKRKAKRAEVAMVVIALVAVVGFAIAALVGWAIWQFGGGN